MNKNFKLERFMKENKPLVRVLLIFLFAFIVFFPKIYLRNNIYYTSVHINNLYEQYLSLKEEQRFLNQQLENKEYENQITDSLILNDSMIF